MILAAMDRTERFYKIDRQLRSERVVSFARLQASLEVSRATLKRDLEYMRSRLNAPIEYDRAAGGYRLIDASRAHPRYELPGIWFSPGELHALLTLQHLVANLRAGSVLSPHIEAVTKRLDASLGASDRDAAQLRRRVRIIDIAARDIRLEHFEIVGRALSKRKRLDIRYFGRGRGDLTARIVSPQRLVHYRDNWYLDAYCHWREDVRSFAVDAIRGAVMLDDPAIDIADHALDRILGSGYGIFAGTAVTWAKLRFSAERARWVSAERWHPQQKSTLDAGGRLLLELPYSDARELVMDILRHGPDVEVIAPDSLRALVGAQIAAMHARYRDHHA